MSNPTPNDVIRETLAAHLPKEENPSLWERLNEPLAVSNDTPIDLKAVWSILNTTVKGETIKEMWEKINRPIEWDVK